MTVLGSKKAMIKAIKKKKKKGGKKAIKMEPGIPPGFPTWGTRAHVLGQSSSVFPATLAH